MLGKERVLAVLEETIGHSTADQTEVLLQASELQLTRFANSWIHQNVAESNPKLSVRAVLGKKIGCASTNRLEAQALRQVVESAVNIARNQAENPDFESLPSPGSIPGLQAFAPATANSTPEERADTIKQVVEIARAAGCAASGSLSAGASEIAVANSLGIRGYFPTTEAHFVTVVSDGEASGYCDATHTDMAALGCRAAAERAVQKCVAGRELSEIEPGDYPVILEEPAVADLLQFLAWLGFGATAVQEGRSFLCDKLGSRVMGEQISIWDDGLDAHGLPMPFDFEGVPKQRVSLIESGVAKGFVYDSYTAAKDGAQSTGHGLPAPNPWGPFPWNLFLATGQSSVGEMIARSDRAILVTRFHYTNVIHPKETVITGMTRDGTFLVEDGRIARPVRKLRFTQSVVEALSGVLEVGRTARLTEGVVTPALRLARFSFTS